MKLKAGNYVALCLQGVAELDATRVYEGAPTVGWDVPAAVYVEQSAESAQTWDGPRILYKNYQVVLLADPDKSENLRRAVYKALRAGVHNTRRLSDFVGWQVTHLPYEEKSAGVYSQSIAAITVRN